MYASELRERGHRFFSSPPPSWISSFTVTEASNRSKNCESFHFDFQFFFFSSSSFIITGWIQERRLSFVLQMNQQCKVCGEPAAGFHFGAFTCEGCKVSLLFYGSIRRYDTIRYGFLGNLNGRDSDRSVGNDISCRHGDNWKVKHRLVIRIPSFLVSMGFFLLDGEKFCVREIVNEKRNGTLKIFQLIFSFSFSLSSPPSFSARSVHGDLFRSFAKLRNGDRFHEPPRGRG